MSEDSTEEESPQDDEARGEARPWYEPEPGQLIGPGHRVGDLLEASNWRILEQHQDYLLVEAPLPEAVLNPRGQLFGGFTPVYCDFMAIFVARQKTETADVHHWSGWMATRDLRVEYLRPVTTSPLRLEGRALHRGRRSHLVEIRFLGEDDELLVLAHVRMVEVPGPPPSDPEWEKVGS